MIDFAAVVIAVAFVVLVGYLVPTVVQLRRTVAQSERLLAQLNSQLPELLRDIKATTHNVQVLSGQAKAGVDRASVLFNAIGNVGDTVNQVHSAVRGQSAALVLKAAGMFQGARAIVTSIKSRFHKDEGGPTHGRK